VSYDGEVNVKYFHITYFCSDWTSLASIYELGEKISDEVLREAKEKVVQAEPIIYLCSSVCTFTNMLEHSITILE